MARTVVACVAAVALAMGEPAWGQNDWQYPDPYFGLLEIEKSRPAAASDGRPRGFLAEGSRSVTEPADGGSKRSGVVAAAPASPWPAFRTPVRTRPRLRRTISGR